MARSRQSDVNFNVNIKGVKDAEQLSKILQKLKQQFEELEGATVKVNENLSKLSSGGSGRSTTKPGDITQRLSAIELGVKKGDIESVQQLTANYGSLVNQIKALERQGVKTDAVQLRAFKTFERLRKEVERNVQAETLNTQSKKKLEVATTQIGEATERSSQAIAQSNEVLKQSNQQVNASLGDLERQGAFLTQNIGFFIQDAPFGIRGVANNISGISNAFELLNRRVNEVNAATGQNITRWQVIRKTLTGPLGISLIIGSILPTILLFATEGFRAWTGSIKGANEALDNTTGKILDFINLQSELRDSIGFDPLGVQKLRIDISRLDSLLKSIAPLTGLRNRLFEARVEASMFGDSIGDQLARSMAIGTRSMEDINKEIEELQAKINSTNPVLVNLSDKVIAKVNEKLEDMIAELKLAEALLQEDPDARFFRAFEKTVDDVIRDVRLARLGFGDLNEAIETANLQLSITDRLMNEAFSANNRSRVDRLANSLEKLQSTLEDPDDISTEEDSFDDRFDIRKQFQKDLLDLQISRLEAEFDETILTDEKLEKLEEIRIERRRALAKEEFETAAQAIQAQEALEREIDNKIDEIQRNRVIADIELQNMLLENGIDNSNDLNDRLQKIQEFYDNRGDIIRLSLDDEEQLKIALAKNDQERRDREEAAEKEFQNRRMELQSVVAQAAITNIQAVSQFATSNARTQFLIQRTAAAATAIINARVAFTKALPNKPLAFATLALGLGQAAAIVSQSFSSASSTGRVGGGFQGFTSFRGFDPTQEQNNTRTPFGGSSGFSAVQSSQANSFPDTVEARFTDGFGKVVSSGMIQLQRQKKDDLGFWQG